MFKFLIIASALLATFFGQCSEPAKDRSELTAGQEAAFAELARRSEALPAGEAAAYEASLAKFKEHSENKARKKAILEGRRASTGLRRTKSELDLVSKPTNTDLGAPRAGRK